MTIYECLGIDRFLVKEEISIYSIYCALGDYKLKLEGHSFFTEIQEVFIRARLCRKGINLIVMEIRLKSPEHIREISFLFQKAISENILFVFVYGNKYIIVRRNFDLTKQSKTLHVDYISFASNWIYKECLEDAIVCDYDLEEFTYNEDVENVSNEEIYLCERNIVTAFEDFLEEIKRFCKCVSKEEISCIRYVVDWIRIHAIGYRINIYDVLDVVKKYEGYQVIGEYLFVEKNCVCAAINELNPSVYFTSLDYTGTYPLQYFNGIKKVATYKEAEILTHYLLYNSEKYSDAEQDVENIPQQIQEFGLIKYEKWHSNRRAAIQEQKRNSYIDNIVKGYYYGEISKTRGVSLFLVRKLQQWGYTFWNELQGVDLDALEGLTQTEYVKLLLKIQSSKIP